MFLSGKRSKSGGGGTGEGWKEGRMEGREGERAREDGRDLRVGERG